MKHCPNCGYPNESFIDAYCPDCRTELSACSRRSNLEDVKRLRISVNERVFLGSKPANYKFAYVIVLLVVSMLLPLPGAIGNLCGLSAETLLGFASIPILILVLMSIVCTPISVCLMVVAATLHQWKEVVLLAMSLLFPLVTFFVIGLVNKPGFDAVMSV